MKNFLISLAIVVVILGAALYLLSHSSKLNLHAAPMPAATQAPLVPDSSQAKRSIVINLDALNNSGETGSATLLDIGGKTEVRLELTGEPLGADQPVHIHSGACTHPGGVKYTLSFLKNGQSDTMLNASLDQLRSGLPLVISVHKSKAETGVHYACGSIAIP